MWEEEDFLLGEEDLLLPPDEEHLLLLEEEEDRLLPEEDVQALFPAKKAFLENNDMPYFRKQMCYPPYGPGRAGTQAPLEARAGIQAHPPIPLWPSYASTSWPLSLI